MRKISTLLTALALSILALSGCKEKQSDNKTESIPAETAATEQPVAIADEANADTDSIELVAFCKSKKSGNAKLPAISWDEKKFEYDNKNRIVKIGATTIAYKSDDLIRVEIRDEEEARTDIIDFAINENTILAEYFQLERSELLSYRDYVMTVNKDGYIANGTYYDCGNGDTTCRNPVGVDTYQYQDGNVTSRRSESEAYTDPYSGVTDEKRENVFEYKYDNKKSPLYNSNTPKWLMQYLSDVQYVLRTVASNNNVIEKNAYGDVTSYKYEYDSDGFPIKRTIDGAIKTSTYCGSIKEESKEHKSVKIGSQTWMAENLNDPSKGGKCYDDKPENCEKYGRLYTWYEAMKACPNGWRVPNNEEWSALVSSAGGTDTSGGYIKASGVGFPAGGKLKAKSGWNDYKGKSGNGTDDFGFSALPGGRGSTNFGIYSSIGEHGYWWSSSDMGEEGPYGAFSRNMFYVNEGVFWGNDIKDDLLSVRCVK